MNNHNNISRMALGLKRMLLIVSAIAVVMPAAAQQLTQRVNVTGVNSTVKELFRQIETQTPYTFGINNSAFDVTRRVNISANHGELREVLDIILAGTGFRYVVSGTHIIIVQGVAEVPKREVIRERTTVIREQPRIIYRDVPITIMPAPQPTPRPTTPRIIVDGHLVEPTPAGEETPTTTIVAPATEPEPEPEPVVQPVETALPILPILPEPEMGDPTWMLKTNLLFDVTGTISAIVEAKIAPKASLDLALSYNPWSFSNNQKWRSLMVQPEVRFWTRQAFAGHFFGVHAQAARYNFSSAPFGKLWKNRYNGNLYGVGVSYGYAWRLGKRGQTLLEPTIGIGYSYLNYGRFDCVECGEKLGRDHTNYFGITKLGINLGLVLGRKKEKQPQGQ